ncbi:uncharacterized protein F4822DRAFT_423804 [Hypoxylon trugodes]|uniref:uncharacterized protein n=1 Tax=Hypoxylon trugodes TaxID=326681 RepID=UPI002192193F|nr:uncharacterized protein F4822DRAFT_423804 [Hypoxylon trugodes]KAI1393334.1 hypothetical protein F4822DRAFT_423804 [Hypoxylon trugodes]
MSLQNLPPEILHHVIEESMPEGFENLLLSCRYVYECGKPLIETNKTRKQKWRRFFLRSNKDYMSSLSRLNQIARNPALARYIEVAWFGLVYEELKQPTNFDISPLRNFITESPYLRKAGVNTEKWAQTILFGPQTDFEKFSALLQAFVLTLLPNVRTVRLTSQMSYSLYPPVENFPQSQNYYPQVWNVLETIRRNIDANPQGASLGKLTTLLVSEHLGYSEKFILRSVSAFLALPSLTKLSITNCVATNDDMSSFPFVWHYPNINSNLRYIELDNGCMDAACVSELLSHTPHLVSFKFLQAAKHHGVHYHWNPGAFIEAIGKHLGDHLEELAVTVDDVYGHLESGVKSLKAFKKLKSLELCNNVFCETDQTIEQEGNTYSKLANDGYVPPLIDMLPPSLENFHLFIINNCRKFHINTMRSLLDNFAAGRPRLLPNLKEFGIRCTVWNIQESDLDEITSLAASQGVSWISRKGIQPLWKERREELGDGLDDEESIYEFESDEPESDNGSDSVHSDDNEADE